MYFDQFESWESAVEGATAFVVTTVTKHGTHVSSPIPKRSLSSVIVEIGEAVDSKSSWWQWDRSSKRIVTIPYEEIVTITIELVN